MSKGGKEGTVKKSEQVRLGKYHREELVGEKTNDLGRSARTTKP